MITEHPITKPYKYTKTFVFASNSDRGLTVDVIDQRNFIFTLESLPEGGFYVVNFASMVHIYDDGGAGPDVHLNLYQNGINAWWDFLQAGTPRNLGDTIVSLATPSGFDQERFGIPYNLQYDWSSSPIFIPDFALTCTSNVVVSNYAPGGNLYYRMAGIIALGFRDNPEKYYLTDDSAI